jgi:signal transduction histidine kinase
MFPDSIPHFSIGPLCGLIANGMLAILCLVIFTLYQRYKPLFVLAVFYIFIALAFLGWVIYGLQKSPQSILLGNRILYASLAQLPAILFWLYLSFFRKRPTRLTWSVTGLGLILGFFALIGKGSLLFGLPLESDPIALDILRPQSLLLKPLIQSFCLVALISYILVIGLRIWRSKKQELSYLLPFEIGLFIWLLGAVHDSLRVAGVVTLSKDHQLWFASLWLSALLTIAIALYVRSLEREMSRLQKAQIDTLEQSRNEHERLSRAKSKALDHLSHELMTPLAVIQGNIRLLKRKAQAQTSPIVREEVFDSLERNLNRISNIQHETNVIIRYHQGLEVTSSPETIDTKETLPMEAISLFPFTERILNKVKENAVHRDLRIQLDGTNGLSLNMDSGILEDILIGLLRNSIENTPDEGLVRVVLEQKGQWIQLKVQDFGVGITNENQRFLFDGLFHMLDTELYTSREPYDFGAGGKGLDLLLIKVYSKRFGFDTSVASQRCLYLPTDRDLCHGRISKCPHCKVREDCFKSGGSTFCLTFPVAGE